MACLLPLEFLRFWTIGLDSHKRMFRPTILLGCETVAKESKDAALKQRTEGIFNHRKLRELGDMAQPFNMTCE